METNFRNNPKQSKYAGFRKFGNYIYLPRIITNLFRNQEQIDELISKGLNPKLGFDNLNDIVILIADKIIELKNSIKDNQDAIDRYSNIIDSKNDKIDFMAYSENYPSNDEYQNSFLKTTFPVNTGNVDGIIVDEDSGLEVAEIIEGDKNFVKFNFDDTKLKGIKFQSASNSSIRISWDDTINGYKVEQNTLLVYESTSPETEIIIDHNLGTKAIDIKTFKIVTNEIDLKFPIVPGMEFPSDNQVRLYLTEPRMVHVLISRL